MGSFVEHIKEKAKQAKKTILLPETMDDRTYYAAEQAMKEGIRAKLERLKVETYLRY